MDYLNLKRRCELEKKIQKRIYDDNNATCHFDYRHIDNQNKEQKVVLTLITSNPKHNELFSLYTTSAHNNEIKCLDEIIVYLDSWCQEDNGYFNYEVVWFRKESPDNKITSYFTGKNYYEIMHRFFENKNPNDFIIVSSHMRPIC